MMLKFLPISPFVGAILLLACAMAPQSASAGLFSRHAKPTAAVSKDYIAEIQRAIDEQRLYDADVTEDSFGMLSESRESAKVYEQRTTDGLDVLKAVRAEPALAGIPVLILTARGQSHDRQLALDLRADGFITKPFANDAVLDEVRRLLSPAPCAAG